MTKKVAETKKKKLKPADINDILFKEEKKRIVESLESTIKLKTYVEPKLSGLNDRGELMYCNLNISKAHAFAVHKMLRYQYDHLMGEWEPMTQTQKAYLKDVEVKLRVLEKILNEE